MADFAEKLIATATELRAALCSLVKAEIEVILLAHNVRAARLLKETVFAGEDISDCIDELNATTLAALMNPARPDPRLLDAAPQGPRQ